MEALLIVVFCLLVISFSLIVVVMILFNNPRKKGKTSGRVVFPALFGVIILLGGALIFLTLSQGMSGVFKVFLILTGADAAAMGIGAILHNVISALIGKLTGKRDIEEPVFYMIGLFGGPVAFLAGLVGSVVMFIRGLVIR